MKNSKQNFKNCLQDLVPVYCKTQGSPIKQKSKLKNENGQLEYDQFITMSFNKKNSFQMLVPSSQIQKNLHNLQKINLSADNLFNINGKKKLIRTELRRNSNPPNQRHLQQIKNKVKKMRGIFELHKEQSEFDKRYILNIFSMWKEQNLNESKKIRKIIQLNTQTIEDLNTKNERLQTSLDEMQSDVNQKISIMKQLMRQKQILLYRKCEDIKDIQHQNQFLKQQVLQSNERIVFWKMQVKNIAEKQAIKHNQLLFKQLELKLMKEELLKRETSLLKREAQVDQLKNQYYHRLQRHNKRQQQIKGQFMSSFQPTGVMKQIKYQKYYKIIPSETSNQSFQNQNILPKFGYYKNYINKAIREKGIDTVLYRVKSVSNMGNSYLQNETNTPVYEKQADEQSSISRNRKTPKLTLRINRMRQELEMELEQLRQNKPFEISSLQNC